MKKYLSAIILTFAISFQAAAQEANSQWTFNTRAWCTNYFTTSIYNLIEKGAKHLLFKGADKDSLWAERIVPDANFVFPIGMGKKGFGDPNNIYGPYHRAFANPIKHIGDYAIGADVSFLPTGVGIYAGAYFKSQEIVWKDTKDNLRGFYFQPRVGLLMGTKKLSYEAGVFYDVVTGCGGSVEDNSKDRLKGGWGLDFAISRTDKKGNSKFLLQFSMPLHNFLNDGYIGQQGMKRKVGYISLTRRICL